eukprot:g15156.t1
MATSMGDMRAERRISGDNLFMYNEIITLDGTNPSSHVGQTIYYGRPYIGYVSQILQKTGGLIFPLWSRRDLNPSTAAFPISHGNPEDRPGAMEAKPGAAPNNAGKEKVDQPRELSKWEMARLRNEEDRKKHELAIASGLSGLKNDTYIEHREYSSPERDVVAKIAAKIEKIQQHELTKIGLELQLIRAESAEEIDEDAIKTIRTAIGVEVKAIADGRTELQDFMITAAEKKPVAAAAGPGEKKGQGNGVGILIIRWATDTEQGLSLDVGEIFDGSLSTKESKSGYLVLGGIRFSSLVLGEDFLRTISYKMSNQNDDQLFTRMLRRGMVGITKYMISAEHVAYVSDLQTELNAQFKADLGKSTLKALDEIDQIKIQYALSTVGSFNNIGQLGDPEVTRPPYVFGKKIGEKETDENDRWMPIYSVIAAPKKNLYDKLKDAFPTQ